MVANTINKEVEEENIQGSNDEEENEGLEITHLGDIIIEEKEELVTPRLKNG